MFEYDVCLHKIVKGTVTVRGNSFADAERSALLADDVEWEPAEESLRDIEYISKQ